MNRVISTLILLVVTNFVAAAEFAVSPMLIDIDSEGGSEERFEISITGKETGKISLSVLTMEQQPSGHMTFLETGAATMPGPVDWVTFDQRSYDIRRDESTTVIGRVRIPRGVDGTHLAAIMVEEDSGRSSSNVTIKVRYAVILNINVGAQGPRTQTEFDELRLVEFEGKTYVEGHFTNNNAHMGFLESVVQVRGADRRLAGQVELRTESAWQRGDARSRVYPGARVRIYAELPRALASGEYDILARNQLNGRTQPVYRATVAHTSAGVGNDTEHLIALAEPIVAVKPLASGLSLTPVTVTNPSRETVTIELPAGADQEQGVDAYSFVPQIVTLRPGMTRRVMLKQSHSAADLFRGQEFNLRAVAESGRSEELVLATIAAEGQ